MKSVRSSIGLLILAFGILCQAQESQPSIIVFVCEHGSAKSVIAAAHFNDLAEKRGLPYRAVSRGLTPDAEIQSKVKSGLSADGLDVNGWKPTAISTEEFKHAERVVTLSCELPRSKSPEGPKRIDWTDLPAVSDGYEEARTAIVKRVDDLLKTLSSGKTQQK